jgi:hypothetical protein
MLLSFTGSLVATLTVNPQFYWFSKNLSNIKLYTYMQASLFRTQKPNTETYFDSLLP